MKALFFFAVLLVASAVMAQDNAYSFKENYKISTPAVFNVDVDDANLEIIPSDNKEIEIQYVVKRLNKLLDIDRKGLEEEMTVAVEQASGQLNLTVKTRIKPSSFFGSNDNRMSLTLRMYVPRQTMCKLQTGDGNVKLSGLTGDQHITTGDGNVTIGSISGNLTGNTSDGNVKMENIKGAIHFSTGDGNIVLNEVEANGGEVELRTGDGNIQLNTIVANIKASTGDGNVSLRDVKGEVSIRTGDGTINFIDLSGSLSAQTTDGSINGNFLKLERELIASTGDGSINISIPDKLGLDIDIHASSIHVPLKDFSGRSDEHRIQGKSNGGGILVKLSTGDGHVSVSYK